MTSLRAPGLVVGLIAALVLTGCADRGPITSTGSPEPSSSPSPTSTTTPAPVAAAIVVDADRLVIEDEEGGELLVQAWDGELDPALIPTLNAILGSEAVVSQQPGDCCHLPPTDVYSWPQLTFDYADLDGEPRVGIPSWISTTAAEINGISIRTRSGLGVGSTVDEVLATTDPTDQVEFEGVRYFWIDLSSQNDYRTIQLQTDGGSVITGMIAPATSGGT